MNGLKMALVSLVLVVASGAQAAVAPVYNSFNKVAAAVRAIVVESKMDSALGNNYQLIGGVTIIESADQVANVIIYGNGRMITVEVTSKLNVTGMGLVHQGKVVKVEPLNAKLKQVSLTDISEAIREQGKIAGFSEIAISTKGSIKFK